MNETKLIKESLVLTGEFIPVTRLSIEFGPENNRARSKLVDFYLEGIRDAESLGVDLPQCIKDGVGEIKTDGDRNA